MSGTRAGALKGWETRRLMHRPTKRNEAKHQRSQGALDYDKQVRHNNLRELQEQEKRLTALIRERGTQSPYLKKDLARVRRDIAWTKKAIREFG